MQSKTLRLSITFRYHRFNICPSHIHGAFHSNNIVNEEQRVGEHNMSIECIFFSIISLGAVQQSPVTEYSKFVGRRFFFSFNYSFMLSQIWLTLIFSFNIHSSILKHEYVRYNRSWDDHVGII